MHVYIHIYACIFVNRTFVVNAVKIRLRLKNTFPFHFKYSLFCFGFDSSFTFCFISSFLRSQV